MTAYFLGVGFLQILGGDYQVKKYLLLILLLFWGVSDALAYTWDNSPCMVWSVPGIQSFDGVNENDPTTWFMYTEHAPVSRNMWSTVSLEPQFGYIQSPHPTVHGVGNFFSWKTDHTSPREIRYFYWNGSSWSSSYGIWHFIYKWAGASDPFPDGVNQLHINSIVEIFNSFPQMVLGDYPNGWMPSDPESGCGSSCDITINNFNTSKPEVTVNTGDTIQL
jgi:hypothetical protein